MPSWSLGRVRVSWGCWDSLFAQFLGGLAGLVIKWLGEMETGKNLMNLEDSRVKG